MLCIKYGTEIFTYLTVKTHMHIFCVLSPPPPPGLHGEQWSVLIREELCPAHGCSLCMYNHYHSHVILPDVMLGTNRGGASRLPKRSEVNPPHLKKPL